MSAGITILIVVILIVVAVAAAVASMRMRRRTADRELVGPEYDRLADEIGPRKARAEFDKRRQRVDGLGIRSLSAERRTAYSGQWDAAQERFVDSPAKAVTAAGELVTAVAVDRGYEVSDGDQLVTDLSVYHGRHLDGYRHARQTTERVGEASTEALRRSLLGYRVLFFDLLESPEGDVVADAREPELEPAAGGPADEVAADEPAAGVPAQRPWKQVTQGRHWKTRQRENSDVAATRQ